MQNRGTWIAFLTMCFALTGMIGLFASYSSAIPLERAMHRLEQLDTDPPEHGIRQAMGDDAGAILLSPGDAQAHRAQARTVIRQEADEEERSVGTRTRWMIFIVTFLSAGIGAGLLLLASRPPA